MHKAEHGVLAWLVSFGVGEFLNLLDVANDDAILLKKGSCARQFFCQVKPSKAATLSMYSSVWLSQRLRVKLEL